MADSTDLVLGMRRVPVNASPRYFCGNFFPQKLAGADRKTKDTFQNVRCAYYFNFKITNFYFNRIQANVTF